MIERCLCRLLDAVPRVVPPGCVVLYDVRVVGSHTHRTVKLLAEYVGVAVVPVRLGQHMSKLEAGAQGVLFDLDGTLIDSVYQHVLAWQEALAAVDIRLPVWRIHRRIGMSGGLFVSALLRETGVALGRDSLRELEIAHADAYIRTRTSVRPLPGASDLLHALTDAGVPWAIATSGQAQAAEHSVRALGLPPDTPLITREQVRYAKPDPDLFLTAAARIGCDIQQSIVVGDSIWDVLAARRARALPVGLLSGGYGRDELERAGAYRVYGDPGDLLAHMYEVGIRDVALSRPGTTGVSSRRPPQSETHPCVRTERS